jgi:hypothetical protein
MTTFGAGSVRGLGRAARRPLTFQQLDAQGQMGRVVPLSALHLPLIMAEHQLLRIKFRT